MNYPDILLDTFKSRFGYAPSIVVRAPGRINLIGEHTDYNMGFVLPAAIDKAIWFAAAPRRDRLGRFFAQNLDQSYVCAYDQLARDGRHWANYLMGVLFELQNAGFSPGGVDVVFGGDIPNGAGVSSSAALEGGFACVLNTLFDLQIPKMEQVRLAQRAENKFVGVNCGIMDMFASIMGRRHACMKLDCRSLEFEYFPFDAPDFTLLLCDTGVKHSLVDSDFNTRRRECEEGVRLLAQKFPGIRSLRDVSLEQLLAEKNELPELIFRRCRYVVEEIERVTRACEALSAGQMAQFGALMYRTHAGLQHEFEVSCPELDFLVDETRSDEAVLGARMMGGGFGGCTINLLRREAVPDFKTRMSAAYRAAYGRELPCHAVELSDGVQVLEHNL